MSPPRDWPRTPLGRLLLAPLTLAAGGAIATFVVAASLCGIIGGLMPEGPESADQAELRDRA